MKARELFNKMHQQNVVSQTTMLAGSVQNRLIDEDLKLLRK